MSLVDQKVSKLSGKLKMSPASNYFDDDHVPESPPCLQSGAGREHRDKYNKVNHGIMPSPQHTNNTSFNIFVKKVGLIQ